MSDHDGNDGMALAEGILADIKAILPKISQKEIEVESLREHIQMDHARVAALVETFWRNARDSHISDSSDRARACLASVRAIERSLGLLKPAPRNAARPTNVVQLGEAGPHSADAVDGATGNDLEQGSRSAMIEAIRDLFAYHENLDYRPDQVRDWLTGQGFSVDISAVYNALSYLVRRDELVRPRQGLYRLKTTSSRSA